MIRIDDIDEIVQDELPQVLLNDTLEAVLMLEAFEGEGHVEVDSLILELDGEESCAIAQGFHTTVPFCSDRGLNLEAWKQVYMEEIQEHEIVIVGGGIAGFATCLALHRFSTASLDSDLPPSESTMDATGRYSNNEGCCVKRKEMLKTMLEALPQGSVMFSSKVTFIEKSGHFKLIHRADGAILKTKVLIGCDGVKSVVAKELALQEPVSSGRSSIRGLVEFSDCHGFEPKICVHFGNGVWFGFISCDVKCVYWFCTFIPSPDNTNSSDEKAFKEDPLRMKQFVLGKIATTPRNTLYVVERTNLLPSK
ncbi:hypothetical protein POM88_011996 [Heracleum sosnowskyi]|uniref:Uncharacterized protein n=1 Tax=Heracleum sosnowskyi TaxID=360622 RepID=A0AAD8MX04_9APIA|nr:hypothetical protein POM88_011996 [Heracleum sosnowskyi]